MDIGFIANLRNGLIANHVRSLVLLHRRGHPETWAVVAVSIDGAYYGINTYRKLLGDDFVAQPPFLLCLCEELHILMCKMGAMM